MKVQENVEGMELNRTNQLLVCADDGGENTNTRNKTLALFDASREVGLEVNAEGAKYMFVSRNQNVGQNHNLLVAYKSIENVA
jgi:hypothetical protein